LLKLHRKINPEGIKVPEFLKDEDALKEYSRALDIIAKVNMIDSLII
jgi:hypothetical protein